MIDLQEFEKLFKPVESFLEEREKVQNALDVIFPSSYIVAEYASKLLDSYIDLLEIYIGDESEWISWFVFDNECGKKGLEAGCGNKMKKIETLKDLYDVLTN